MSWWYLRKILFQNFHFYDKWWVRNFFVRKNYIHVELNREFWKLCSTISAAFVVHANWALLLVLDLVLYAWGGACLNTLDPQSVIVAGSLFLSVFHDSFWNFQLIGRLWLSFTTSWLIENSFCILHLSLDDLLKDD